MNLPQIHVPRADGGYETRAMTLADVLGWIGVVEVPLQDLRTLAKAVAELFNSKTAGAKIDAQVAAIEMAADVAEVAKVGVTP